MDYRCTSVETLSEKLKDGIVEFEYKKKDGSIRKAKGTLKKEFLPEEEIISFPVDAIDVLMKEKNIQSLEEYAKPNGLKYIEKRDSFYTFKFTKENENTISYFDLEKKEFRSFIKENFLGIL